MRIQKGFLLTIIATTFSIIGLAKEPQERAITSAKTQVHNKLVSFLKNQPIENFKSK